MLNLIICFLKARRPPDAGDRLSTMEKKSQQSLVKQDSGLAKMVKISLILH